MIRTQAAQQSLPPCTVRRLYDHRGVPLPVVRHLTRQLLVALDYLHTRCQIIHTGERRRGLAAAGSRQQARLC